MQTGQATTTTFFDPSQPGTLQGAVTNFDAPPTFADLEQRMVYSARLDNDVSFRVGINPIASAAAGLLSEIVRFKTQASLDTSGLKEGLSGKLKQFEASAVKAGVENSDVMAARYVLCTVIDEAVVTAAGTDGGAQWSQASLLSVFHNETFGGEKFFQLLDAMSANPGRYLHMLELMYLCLSLGFLGKYALNKRADDKAETTRHKLCLLIRGMRGEPPRDISPHWQGLKDVRPEGLLIIPGWAVCLFTVCVLTLGYLGFSSALSDQRNAVLQPFQSLDSTPREPQS